MSKALPMTAPQRADRYRRQNNGGRLTARQKARIEKKQLANVGLAHREELRTFSIIDEAEHWDADRPEVLGQMGQVSR